MIKYEEKHIKATVVIFLFFYLPAAMAQNSTTLTLDSCYAMALRNYPLVKQFSLIEKSKEYSIDNISKGYLPQLSVAGQAHYQSDVTQITLSEGTPQMPFDFPTISKDQYRVYGEVVQPITDLFTTLKSQKEIVRANAEVETQKTEVELYQLRERVNQVFFGALLIDGQIRQTEIIKDDIQAGIDKTQAAIENGTALKGQMDLLKAELLKIRQKAIELHSAKKNYLEMLGLLIDQPISENTVLVTPEMPLLTTTIDRPELKLFAYQQYIYDVQSQLLTAKTRPRFSLFLQSGYGRPALNMLNNEFDYYYIGGVRLHWNLTSFYTYKKEKQLMGFSKDALEIQKETFLFNTGLTIRQQNNEIAKLQELIDTDDEIITLRENLKNTAQSQLENGTLTALDYLNYVNAEDKAKQERLLHQVQLLMMQHNHQYTTGNY